MTFLAPLFLVAAAAAASVVVALHFLVTRPPPLVALPTARFIPAASVIVTSFVRRPEHLLLLLLRVLALLLLGAAFARPVFTSGRRPVARIVLADRSRAVLAIGEVRDSLRALLGSGDRAFAFDSTVRPINAGAFDSLAPGAAVGSLSAALVAARQAGSNLSLSADSIELVLISPLGAEEWDAAGPAIRQLWPGRIRLVRVSPRAGSGGTTAVSTAFGPGDPLAATARLAHPSSPDGGIRVVRRAEPTAEETGWVEQGGALVLWPEAEAPHGWLPAERVDTSGAVLAGREVVIFPFVRRWRGDSATLAASLVVARWADGAAAAIETPRGTGCLRTVTIPVSARGDYPIRPDVVRLFRSLTAPCAGHGPVTPLGNAELAALNGTGALASRAALHPPEDPETPIVPWLLAAALVLILLELFVRRQRPAATELRAGHAAGTVAP